MNSKTHGNVADKKIEHFLVAFSLRCNLCCAHCCNASGPQHQSVSSFDEIEKIATIIESVHPVNILFAGGESTLFIREINHLLSFLNVVPNIILTTNGWFAESMESIEQTLDVISRINTIQLSFDRFHGKRIGDPEPSLLKKYCSKKDIRFVCISCINSVEDTLFAAEVEKYYDVSVGIQKIDASGRAKSTNVEFKYPYFDSSVLDTRCPNSNTLSFIHGKGLTVCCGNSASNLELLDIYSNDYKALQNLKLYKEVTERTMRERLSDINIDANLLSERMSSSCNLCEFILRTGGAI